MDEHNHTSVFFFTVLDQALGLGYRARYIRETAASLLAKPNQAADGNQSTSPLAEGVKSDGDLPSSAECSDNDFLAGLPFPTTSEAEARNWLYGLRDASAYTREEVQAQLMSFIGVGQKVADCAALFSLDRADIVPVDVHVWRIAERDLDPTLSETKSLTPQVYKRVGDLFRDKYPMKTGWAHSLLFAAELPGFIDLIPEEVGVSTLLSYIVIPRDLLSSCPFLLFAQTRLEMEKFKVEEKRRNAEKKAAKRAYQMNPEEESSIAPDVICSMDGSEQKSGEHLPPSTPSSMAVNNEPSKKVPASPTSTPKKKRPRK